MRRDDHAARRATGLGVVFACVIGTMVLGAASKGPCASGDWSDLRQYRQLCYSDIVPLLDTEQFRRLAAAVPRRRATPVEGRNCDEYPVVTMYVMRLASWVSGDDYAPFFWVNALLLTGFAVAIAVMLYVANGSNALYFALAPTLLVYGTMNWDLVAVALATAGLLAFFRRRDRWRGRLRRLGSRDQALPRSARGPLARTTDQASASPTARSCSAGPRCRYVAPRQPPRRGARPDRLADVLPLQRRARRRFRQPLVHRVPPPGLVPLNPRDQRLVACALPGLAAAVWMIKAQRIPTSLGGRSALPLLVLFLLTNKVYSPQYGLWLLPGSRWHCRASAVPRVLVRRCRGLRYEVLVVRTHRGGTRRVAGALRGRWCCSRRRAAWCLVLWLRREASRSTSNAGRRATEPPRRSGGHEQ